MKKERNNKPSDSAKEDRQRNDALNKSERDTDKKLPGEYPPNEDIMNRQNMQRVGLDVENFSRAVGIENFSTPDEPTISDRNAILDEPDMTGLDSIEQPPIRDMESPVPKDLIMDDDRIEFGKGNESDVTEEDMQALGPKDLSMDMGEDEALKNRVWPVDMAGGDLDVPGVPDDATSKASGHEDEENDFYSLGGDRLEDNMEGK